MSYVLPLPHLIKMNAPVVDPLEFARGALCATSFVATDAARETHVSRLHNLFERAGLAASMADALGTMQFMREAEPLGGGYWIPTPVRTVDLGSSRCLLVGPQPTSELQRHFAGVRRAGAGRAMDRADLPELPSQSQDAWRGSDGRDACAWTQSAVDSALKQLASSLVADSLQVLGTRIASGRRRELAWVEPGSGAACEWRGIGLFRARTGATRYRYFFGKYESGKEFLEGPPVQDVARLQFGFAALQRQPMTVTFTAMSGATSISLPLAPPRNVRRLLVALCDADPRSSGRVWTCRDPVYLPVLLGAIQELKCEIAHHE
ncbi:hypothetical protein ACVBGC_09185 [Burkholderia stagnalis]